MTSLADLYQRNRAGDLEAIPVQPEDVSTWWDRVKAAWASGGWQDPQPGQRGTFVPSRINEQGKAEPAVPGIIQQPAEGLQALMTAPLGDIVRSGDRDAMRAASEASFDVASMLPAAGVAAGRMRPRGTAQDRALETASTPQPREYSTGPEQIVPDYSYGRAPFQEDWPYRTPYGQSARTDHGQDMAFLDPIGIYLTEVGVPGAATVLKYQDMPTRMKTVGQDPVPGVRGMDGRAIYSNPDDLNTSAILLAMQGQDKPKGITAYHGSPHDFDKFDLSKIGTGEGAQAYGHGLYFAENEGVARSYRDPHSSNVFKYDGVPAGQNWQTASLEYLDQKMATTKGVDVALADAIQRLKKQAEFHRTTYENGDPAPNLYDGAVARLEKLDPSKIQPPGRMYEVRINADPNDFLDWDKPLSQQPERIRKAMTELANGEILPDWNGMEAYRSVGSQMMSNLNLESPELASRIKGAGIPGVKYLDQGSRVAGEGSRNYVVFDDSLIEILKKYSNPADPTTAAILALLTQQQGQQSDNGGQGSTSYGISDVLNAAFGISSAGAMDYKGDDRESRNVIDMRGKPVEQQSITDWFLYGNPHLKPPRSRALERWQSLSDKEKERLKKKDLDDLSRMIAGGQQ